MIQEALVFVIVSVAVASLIVHYMPRGLRHAFRTRLIRLARRGQWAWLERKLAARARTDNAQGGHCAACSACAPTAAQDGVVSRITPDQLRGTIRR